MIQIPSFAVGLPWKWIGAVAGAIAIVAAVVFSIHAYGNARYEAGQSDERAAWEKAADKIEAESRSSAERAGKAAQRREEEYVEAVAAERQQIEEAIEEGSSPLDVLFGG